MQKSNRFFIPLTIFLFIFNCTKKARYSNSLYGVKVYKEAKVDSEVIGTIEFSEPIFIQDDKPLPDNMIKISFQGKTAFVEKEFLSTEKVQFYYNVIASNLNLRSSPGLKSEKLILLPKGTKGEILSISKDAVTIDGRKGFWFQTKFQDKEGWIFSGYTLIATTLDYFQEDLPDVYKISIRSVDPYSGTLEQFTGKGKIELSYENSDFKVYQVSYPKTDDCDSPDDSILFESKLDGRLFYDKGVVQQTIRKTNYPIQDSILTYSIGCKCCCPWSSTEVYFLRKTVQAIYFEDTNTKPMCFFGDEYKSNYSENRITPENHLLTFWKFSDCRSFGGVEIDSEHPVAAFKGNLFADIFYEGDSVKIEQFRNVEIPAKYSESWQNSTPIK